MSEQSAQPVDVPSASNEVRGVLVTEYPPNGALDSVSISRVSALRDCSLTQRPREFLVTVMVHSGCFLERQYCEFTSTVRGQNSREFVARLIARGFVRAIEPGPIRRGRLYHIYHKPLYEAIGQSDNRNRPLCTIGRMVERVMILDAVLGERRCWWLSPECDKRAFFDVTQGTGLSPEEYPHLAFGAGRTKTIRCFPDKLPVVALRAVSGGGSAAEPSVPPALRRDGPRCVGKEGGQAKIASDYRSISISAIPYLIEASSARHKSRAAIAQA